MKVEVNGVKQIVDAKVLKLHLKVRDEFYASLEDINGVEIKDYEGYVPDLMPGKHYGDYVILDIDIENGQITNWQVPTPQQIAAFIDGTEE